MLVTDTNTCGRAECACSGGWQPTCVLLGHLAISWVTRDIIPGYRRALLSVHVSEGVGFDQRQLKDVAGQSSCTVGWHVS